MVKRKFGIVSKSPKILCPSLQLGIEKGWSRIENYIIKYKKITARSPSKVSVSSYESSWKFSILNQLGAFAKKKKLNFSIKWCSEKCNISLLFLFFLLFFLTGSGWPTIIWITFWYFLMFYPIFLSPQVKRCAIITYKYGIHKLRNDFRLNAVLGS